MDITIPNKFELIPIEHLKPYEKNSRTHSHSQIGKIMDSMVQFGFTNPILVDKENGVIAGHGRLEAAKSLGLKEVPVVFLDHLTEQQKRAYVIADNKLAELAGWDTDILAQELKSLVDENFNIELVGYSEVELEKMLGTDAEEIKPPELPSGPKVNLTQMTFTVTEDQKNYIVRALDHAKSLGHFDGTGNENSNGNALARVAEMYVGKFEGSDEQAI